MYVFFDKRGKIFLSRMILTEFEFPSMFIIDLLKQTSRRKLNTKTRFLVLACPFLTMVVGGSFLLAEFIKPGVQFREQTQRVTEEKELKLRRRAISHFSLQQEYLRLQHDLNIDDWELKPVSETSNDSIP